MSFILNFFLWICEAFVWLVDKCMKRIWKECNDQLPPFRIQLLPANDAAWTKSPAVQGLVSELTGLGFSPAGVYDVIGMKEVRVMGWVHPPSSVVLLIYSSGKKNLA